LPAAAARYVAPGSDRGHARLYRPNAAPPQTPRRLALINGDYLRTKWKAQEEFGKSQGWLTGYEVLANPFKRAGEPDLYLVQRYRTLPDAAEEARRDQIMRDHMKMDDTQADADSASRAKYRHVTSSELLQVMTMK
jgi:hypothetical protein